MGDVPRSKTFDDIYFSAEDACAETDHVFLTGNHLPERFVRGGRFTICETGFGTGLNFLMAWHLFSKVAPIDNAHLHFISFEKYPLSAEEIRKYLSFLDDQNMLNRYLEKYPTHLTGTHSIAIEEHVQLTLYFGDVNEELPTLKASVDAWFLDGFAPAKNPDMWRETLFEHMSRLSAPSATFATFTAAGFVKRGLQNAGFNVEKVKGFGRKREMLRGVFQGA